MVTVSVVSRVYQDSVAGFERVEEATLTVACLVSSECCDSDQVEQQLGSLEGHNEGSWCEFEVAGSLVVFRRAANGPIIKCRNYAF